jgi:vitamin K epoxide reductase family protein
MQPDVPPGFHRDPTAWPRRRMLLMLAVTGLGVAGYLTLYQFGVVTRVWDPVFGERSSRAVLTLADPVPDAAAGALAYLTEIVLLLIGPPGRWRTMPWTCLALGAVLTLGAVVSVALIVVQATLAQHWCALCLASAGLSLGLFVLGIGEARAAREHVRHACACGVSLNAALRGVTGPLGR